MQKVKFDPGLTTQYGGRIRRAINQDGSFNVRRHGTGWRDIHPYLKLIEMPWPHFFGVILLAYAFANLVFAAIYYMLGPDALQGGLDSSTALDRFLKGVFFSSQTLTTVGFGAISPRSAGANVTAALEAMSGLLGFAVATGLLFGRVSRPSARIGFSSRALIAPYQDGTSFQFRIVNRRTNTLMELEATVMMMTVDRVGGILRRDFEVLRLERKRVLFFPLTWTIVHPIDPDSPLAGKTLPDLELLQAEFLIQVKAWDETFSQTVHQRFSYRYDEIVWGARFSPAFDINESGDMVLRVDQLGAYTQVS
jgi:inward rectifier potassium channel